MPVSMRSRYHGLPVYNAPARDGKSNPTIPIRRSGPPPQPGTQYNHLVTGLENVEYLAYRFYGASDSWWRIADANPLGFPLDIRSGESVAIPNRDTAGRVTRTRRF